MGTVYVFGERDWWVARASGGRLAYGNSPHAAFWNLIELMRKLREGT